MTQTFSISDLAQEFAITPRTLRFYEEKGLLKPTRQGQTRIYSQADRTRLKLVLRGKRLGLSLEDSAEIIAMYDPRNNNRRQLERLCQAIAARKAHLLEQRRELDALLEELDRFESRTRDALDDHPRTDQRHHGALS